MLESKGKNCNHQAIILFVLHKDSLQFLLQFPRKKIGRIDDIIRFFPDITENFSFLFDAILNSAIRRKGMYSSRFLISFQKCLVIRLHKQNLKRISVCFELLQDFLNILKSLISTHIKAKRNLGHFSSRCGNQLYKFFNQRNRKIVHTIESHILQHSESSTLPTAAHTRNNYKTHAAPPQKSPRKITSVSSETPNLSFTLSCTSRITSATSAADALPVLTTKPQCFSDTRAPPME